MIVDHAAVWSHFDDMAISLPHQRSNWIAVSDLTELSNCRKGCSQQCMADIG
jgi:hypothetical protein